MILERFMRVPFMFLAGLPGELESCTRFIHMNEGQGRLLGSFFAEPLYARGCSPDRELFLGIAAGTFDIFCWLFF